MAKEKQTAITPDKTGENDKAEKLADQLLNKTVHLAEAEPQMTKEAFDFCEGYKTFMDDGKTEREAATAAVALLKKAGYKAYQPGKKLKSGDKVYLLHRSKAIIAATIGSHSLEQGLRITAAHIDSPRLDIKPNPLYEAEQLAYFKTHYYGGVRKYQWVTIPLSMHGVVVNKDGSKVTVRLGEAPGEPVFTITDLLPHLSKNQDKRTLAEGIRGEELNILMGSLPFEQPDAKDAVKLETMRLLNQKYGITERDFMRAELEFVPAFRAADVGIDASMVGAYGQDDRVCAYTALMAEIDTKNPEYTSVCTLADKEEIGSEGNTGLASEYLFHFLQQLALAQQCDYLQMLAASECLSADVNAAYDPTFTEPFEKQNSTMLNRGVALMKYGGARGKSGSSDASAEFVGKVTCLLDAAGIPWQSGELGKVDAGGGGTVAMFVAKHNIDVLDIGVPVLSMHSPFEVTSKLDIYCAYRAFRAFCGEKAPSK